VHLLGDGRWQPGNPIGQQCLIFRLVAGSALGFIEIGQRSKSGKKLVNELGPFETHPRADGQLAKPAIGDAGRSRLLAPFLQEFERRTNNLKRIIL
jgi:hypothetical protein